MYLNVDAEPILIASRHSLQKLQWDFYFRTKPEVRSEVLARIDSTERLGQFSSADLSGLPYEAWQRGGRKGYTGDYCIWSVRKINLCQVGSPLSAFPRAHVQEHVKKKPQNKQKKPATKPP